RRSEDPRTTDPECVRMGEQPTVPRGRRRGGGRWRPQRLRCTHGAMRTSRHAPPPGAPSARSAARPRLALAALLGLLCACGHDDADPVAATADRNPPSRDVAPPPRGPLATYRLATTRSADGETLTIEALAPCRITLEVEQGAS